jgi:zinc-ribbon domain
MFCPKCGTQNPDDGKFCRSCGVDLGNVNAAISGELALTDDSCSTWRDRKPRNADQVFADAMKSIVTGVGFIVVSCVLYVTNVANGRAWFWAMLIPAFTFLAKGISDYSKSRRMDRARQVGFQPTATVNQMRGPTPSTLPSAQTTFIAPAESRYKTGDLVPPSVTDGTTRHLESNPEGETMTLPKVQ